MKPRKYSLSMKYDLTVGPAERPWERLYFDVDGRVAFDRGFARGPPDPTRVI